MGWTRRKMPADPCRLLSVTRRGSALKTSFPSISFALTTREPLIEGCSAPRISASLLFSSIGVARPVSRISLFFCLPLREREDKFLLLLLLVVYDEGEEERKGSGGNSVVPRPSSSQTNGIGTNEAGSPLIPKREMRMEVVREIIPYTHVPCGVSMRKIDFFKAPRPQFLTRFLIGNDIPRRASPSGRGNNTQDRFSSRFSPPLFSSPYPSWS